MDLKKQIYLFIYLFENTVGPKKQFIMS